MKVKSFSTRTSTKVIYDLINIRYFVSVCDTAILSFKMFIALWFFSGNFSNQFFLRMEFRSFLLLRVKWFRLTLIFWDMMNFIFSTKKLGMAIWFLINRKLCSIMSILIMWHIIPSKLYCTSRKSTLNFQEKSI
jgi:hypothetical protein